MFSEASQYHQPCFFTVDRWTEIVFVSLGKREVQFLTWILQNIATIVKLHHAEQHVSNLFVPQFLILAKLNSFWLPSTFII